MAPRLRAVAVVLSVSSLIGACSDDPAPAPGTRSPSVDASATDPASSPAGGPSTTSPAPTRPEGDPDRFDVVGSTTFPEVGVRDIGLTDDVALTLTSLEVTGRALPALTTSFTLPAPPGSAFTDLDVEDGGPGVVVATGVAPGRGTRVGHDTFTVTEFDPTTGETGRTASVRVEQDPLAGNPGSTGVRARIVAAGDRYVVLDYLSAAVPVGDLLGESTARHTAVVVDLDDAGDEPAWSERPATALTTARGLVVVKTGTARKGGQLRALALADGTLRWSALSGTKSARLVGAGPTRVVVTRLAVADDDATVVGLSLADGSVEARRPTSSWIWTCFESSRPVALCNVLGRPVLVAWDLEQGEPAWRLPDRRRFGPTLSTVVRDRAYGILGQEGVVLDAATGRELSANTGAAPTEVSVWGGLSLLGDRAVFQPVAGQP